MSMYHATGLSQWLPKVGIVQTAPWVLVHGPFCSGGFNIPDLYMEQLVSQLVMLIRHSQVTNDTTSKLIHATAEALKLECSIQGEFLEIPVIYQDLVTDSWIKQIWLQCKQVDIHLSTTIHEFQPQRSNNIEITHLFVQQGYGGKELTLLSWCQMFLQVTWLSEVCTGDESSIHILSWQGECSTVTDFNWPIVHQPLESEWHQWQQALTWSLLLDRWYKLSQPLGSWLPQSKPAGWFFEPKSQHLWHWKDNKSEGHGVIP